MPENSRGGGGGGAEPCQEALEGDARELALGLGGQKEALLPLLLLLLLLLLRGAGGRVGGQGKWAATKGSMGAARRP